MNDATPNYIFCLFLIIIGVLFYIIATWAWTTLRKNKNALIIAEGFANTNPQYTYLPNSSSPNLFIKFGLADLAMDISCACDFIKVDNNLNSVKNMAATSNSPTSPSSAPSAPSASNTSMTPAPYTNATPTPSKKIESFTTEGGDPVQTTQPQVSGNTSATSSSVDVNATTTTPTPEPTEEPTPTTTQPPIPTSSAVVTEPPATINGEYTVPYTELPIYKMYNSVVGYSNNANIFKMMDISYGALFDTSKIGNLTDANIARMWETNVSISVDDALYNGSKYFVIQSAQNNRQCASAGKEWPGLSSYFLRQIQKNKSRSSVLLSLKNAYYSIIKPRFLMNALSNIYWQNAQSFTNSDKGTNNSVLFVLNTCSELATKNTLATDLSASEVAQIISEDTPFTFDALWLYQMTSLAFELHRYVAYFQTNGSVTSGNKTPAITTTVDRFVSGFPKYLQTINQVAPSSPLVFLLQYLPSNADCPIVSKLTPYANNIQY